MIVENYCSFEIAKLLKKKGFNCPCRVVYSPKGIVKHYLKEEVHIYDLKGHKKLCPTHQMAMKWLRDVHNITIEPLVDFGSSDKYWWSADISYIKKDGLITTLTAYNTYEEAVEEALKYVLENLI